MYSDLEYSIEKFTNLRHASSGVHRRAMHPTTSEIMPWDMHMPNAKVVSKVALHGVDIVIVFYK
jgi:hypothetical protein